MDVQFNITDMAQDPNQTGHIPFQHPSLPIHCSTYYKAFGDLAHGPPVLVLHGGPGAGHEYCLSYADLWTRFGIPVIFYDQIGCAASTHLPDRAGDRSFWREELFIAELENVIDFFQLHSGFHLLGQSWGGMLAAAFASTRPKGLRRLILAGAVASIELSIQCVDRLRQELPPSVQAAIKDAERRNDFGDPAYLNAVDIYAKKHFCRVDPFPPDVAASLGHLVEDKTVYGTMYGPSTLTCVGSLVNWTCIPRLPSITATTLVMNGEFDSSDDRCTAPFFEHIPRVRWITFAGGAHMCHYESVELREKVIGIVGDFLRSDGR